MLVVSAVGAAIAGIYGVIHDQITYTISEEYFTRFKFIQFSNAKPASDDPRVFVGIIGFLASWWVGAFVGWILARISISREGRLARVREMAVAYGIVFFVASASAGCGWIWGQWRRGTGYAEGWLIWMEECGVVDQDAFMTVGYIHNASYLGGILGAAGGIAYLRKLRHCRAERELLAA